MSRLNILIQNPADGYFRVPHVGPVDFTDLIGIIGKVEQCNCHGHNGICDPETGKCQVYFNP